MPDDLGKIAAELRTIGFGFNIGAVWGIVAAFR